MEEVEGDHERVRCFILGGLLVVFTFSAAGPSGWGQNRG